MLNIKKNKMILSMTGYGKAETIVNDKKIHVEIKSLNSKNIDISTHLSSIFQSKDLEIRTYLIQNLIFTILGLLNKMQPKQQPFAIIKI